jgi:hypothetical protein
MYQRLILTAVLLLAVCGTPVLSQDLKGDLLGVSVLGEYTPDSGVTPSVGFVFERKLSPRSGIESGIFYRTNKTKTYWDLISPEGDPIYGYTTVRESYLRLPVLYRYYTEAVTVSVGPTLEAFVGWDQVSPEDAIVTAYKRSPSFDLGPLLKVSKLIALRGNLILEPEFRFGIMARSSTAHYGLGIQLKQRWLSKD